jgi:rhodanese-related sulfurtransferase
MYRVSWKFLFFLLMAGVIVCQPTAAGAEQNNEFPLRWRYPDVKTLSTQEFYKMHDRALVVDARTRFEWETMRVNGSINVPVDEVDTGRNRAFEAGISKVEKSNAQPIVFYCNGKTCAKSYEAARRAQRAGITDIYAYDAGIFDWANAHPELTTLYEKTPIDRSDLISPADLKAHMLPAKDFRARANADKCNCIIVDIRDRGQRDFLLFPMREEHVKVDDKAALNALIEQAKLQRKTLLIYDAVGKQVMWLQYYLVRHGAKDYFFMQGGENGYVSSLP